MKTIVARFTEMKKAPGEIVEVEGEEVNVNKVEAALKSVGVALRDTNGEFRDLDDVFLELSSKWDSLDKMSQRYVATTAAGSRQQSRFIAMMSNYNRTMELTSYATNSAGASQKQFEKTMDSLESKLNLLHNAWEQFTTGLSNQAIIKGIVTALTSLLTTINEVTDAIDPLHTGWSKLLMAFWGFKAAKGIVNGAIKNIGAQMAIGMGKEGVKAGGIFSQGFTQGLKNIKMKFTGNNSPALVKQINKTKEGSQAYKELAQAQEASRVASIKLASAQAEEGAAVAKLNHLTIQQVNQGAQVVSIGAQEEAVRAAKTATQGAEAAVEEAEIKVKEKEAVVNRLVYSSEQRLQAIHNLGIFKRVKLAAAIAFGNQKKKLEILQNYGLITSEQAEAVAKNEMTLAQLGFNSALEACPVMWIITAIVALIAVVAILVKVFSSFSSDPLKEAKEELEKTEKALEGVQEALSETTDRVNELNDSWDKLKTAKEELKKLKQGTLEWKQKLAETNKEVLELIDKYPTLSQFVTTGNSGEMSISQEGMDYIIKQQTDLTQLQGATSLFLSAEKADRQNEVIRRDSTSSAEKLTTGIASNNIQRDTNIQLGTAQLVDNFILDSKDKYSEIEQNFLKSSLASKKTYEAFEKLKKNTKANVFEYAKLVGLTEEEVKKKKEEGNLTDDAISATLALNKYINIFNDNLQGLSNLYRTGVIKADTTLGRAMSGVNTLRASDLQDQEEAVNQLRSRFSKDGEIFEGKEDEVRNILTKKFGFDSAVLKQIEDSGGSITNIVNNIINSSKSLQSYEKISGELSNSNQKQLSDFISNTQKILGEELETSQQEQLANVFSNIAKSGGITDAFTDNLTTIFKNIPKTKMEEILASLNSIDFSSQSSITNFINNLDNLDDALKVKVRDGLIQATKAASDFSLSHFTDEIKDFSLASTLQTKKDTKSNIYTDKEYEQVTKNLEDNNREDLKKYFQRVGLDYLFTGDNNILDQLIDTSLGRTENTKAQIDLEKKQQQSDSWREKFDGVSVSLTDYSTQGIWDIDALSDLLPQATIDKIKNAKTAAEKERLYVEGLMYRTDKNGEVVHAETGISDENDQLYNFDLLQTLIDRMQAMTSEERQKVISLLPEKYKNQIVQAYSQKFQGGQASQTIDWDQGSTGVAANLGGVHVYGDYAVGLITNLLKAGKNQTDQIDGFDYNTAAADNSWKIEKEASVENLLKQFKEKGIELEEEEIEKMKTMTTEQLENYISELKAKYDLSSEDINALDTIKKTKYQGITDIDQLLDLQEKTTDSVELNAIKTQIDAIIQSHQGWEIRLKQIQAEYNTTEESAKKLLALEYKRNAAVDSIRSVLSDNKDLLSEENIAVTKGTEKYNAAIESMVVQFQKIFGEKIDSDWVEKHIDDIRKLSEGGEVANQAMERLAATEKAVPTSVKIEVEVIGDKKGEIDEVFYNKFQTYFDNISKGAGDVTTNISKIKDTIADLNKSNIDIQVKANTLAALAELIRLGLVKAIVDNNSDDYKELIGLAQEAGFSVSGQKKILGEASVSKGEITYSFKTNNEGIAAASINVKAPTLIDTREETGDIYGNSGTTTTTDKDKDETKSDWTNDWDRQYAVLKKIESLERERNRLSKEQQRFLKTGLLNEKKILKTKEDQRRNLMQQIKLNEDLVKDADAWLRGMNNDGRFDGAIWWDDEHKTIRTNDAYIRSMDEDTKKEFDKVKEDYEHYYSQRNTADSNIDTAIDAIEELTSSITELDFHSTTEKLIAVIDNVISLYDKAEKRLEWSERNVNSKDIVNLYDAKSKELIEKSKALTTDFIQTEATINTLLNKPEYKKYYNYDWKTGKVTTTGAYDAIVDSDIKSNVKDFIDKLNTYSQQRASDDSERIDIQDTLREMEQAILTKAESFRKNVYDAIVNQREEEISRLENINSSIQSAAADLVSSIQKNIQKIRQERSNKKTEEELAKMQSRLDFLRMDTSSGNQKNILDLEKQLEEKEQSYTDTLIDQKISELQDQNTEAEKQRKQQIEVMKTQLEVQKDNGLIWSDVRYLIANGLSASGKIKEGSELDTALKSWGKYSSLSEQGKKDWSHEQNLGASNFDAYYSQGLNNRGYDQKIDYSANGADKSYDTIKQQMINAYKQGLIESINNTTPYRDYMRYDSKNNKLIQTKLFPHPNDDKALNSTLQNAWDQAWSTINTIYSLDSYFKTNSGKNIVFTQVPNIAHYATGGLADYTGPAWLDGTPSSPELVLNQRDTKNFIQLKDILSSVMNDTSTQTKPNGDYYFEIAINVDKVTSDYDVDQIADRIKQQISDSARYRNVNVINLLR